MQLWSNEVLWKDVLLFHPFFINNVLHIAFFVVKSKRAWTSIYDSIANERITFSARSYCNCTSIRGHVSLPFLPPRPRHLISSNYLEAKLSIIRDILNARVHRLIEAS